jgi:hypothetical protein
MRIPSISLFCFCLLSRPVIRGLGFLVALPGPIIIFLVSLPIVTKTILYSLQSSYIYEPLELHCKVKASQTPMAFFALRALPLMSSLGTFYHFIVFLPLASRLFLLFLLPLPLGYPSHFKSVS